MDTTPIPDRKAASKLGVSYTTIRNAVDRGDLTRVPMKGQLQHVVEEQIDLFEGMNRIVKEKLPPEKLKKWHVINDTIVGSYAQQTLQNEVRLAPITIGSLNFPPGDTTELMIRHNVGMEATPTPSGGMLFPTAQLDEADNNAEMSLTLWQAFVILAGLLALFFMVNALKKRTPELEQAQLEAEEELLKTGLSEGDLANTEKSAVAFTLHPKPARRIHKIVRNAGIPVPALAMSA